MSPLCVDCSSMYAVGGAFMQNFLKKDENTKEMFEQLEKILNSY